MRYWTSDWHINSDIVRKTSSRPWKTTEEMNTMLLRMTYGDKVSLHDQVIHVGDLIQSGKDRGTEIAKDHQLTYEQIANKCACQLICIEGNHDGSNNVPFICRSMKTRVGNWNVTVGHYPSWNDRALGTYVVGAPGRPTVHICGHVHGAFKVSYDKRNYVLNINVGVDAHGYKLLSDAALVNLIEKAMRWHHYVDTTPDHWFGDGYGFAEWERDLAEQKRTEKALKNAKMMEWLKVNKPEVYAAKAKKALNS